MASFESRENELRYRKAHECGALGSRKVEWSTWMIKSAPSHQSNTAPLSPPCLCHKKYDMPWQDPRSPLPLSRAPFLCFEPLRLHLGIPFNPSHVSPCEKPKPQSHPTIPVCYAHPSFFSHLFLFQHLKPFHHTLSGIQSATTKSSMSLTSSLTILALTRPWLPLKGFVSKKVPQW